MFGIEFTGDTVRTYGQAYTRWNNAKPWRGKTHTHDERPLDKRNKKHMSVRLGSDEQIIFRLHGTDVVTYFKDGTVGIVPYSSQSTDRFASNLLPDGVYPCFNSWPYDMIQLGRIGTYKIVKNDEGKERGVWEYNPDLKLYRLTKTARIRFNNDSNMWELIDPATMSVPFVKKHVDMTKANAALKTHNFKQFREWIRAMEGIGYKWEREMWFYDPNVVWELYKAGPEKWPEILKRFDNKASLLYAMRRTVYSMESCIVRQELPFAQSWDEVKAISASQRKY